jgi:hypothetical protein
MKNICKNKPFSRWLVIPCLLLMTPLLSIGQQVLFHSGFEQALPGKTPDKALVGSMEFGGVIFANQGQYRVDDGPASTKEGFGHNYLVVDRKNQGGNDLLFIFDGEGTTLNETTNLTVQFYIWGNPIVNASFGLTNGSGWGGNTIATWNNLFGTEWQVWDGGGWAAPIGISDYLNEGEWNKVTFVWDTEAQTLTGMVNDAGAVEMLLWGGADLFIDRLRLRGGDNASIYFLDEVAVVIDDEPIPELEPPGPRLPAPVPGEEFVLFEADGEGEGAEAGFAPPADEPTTGAWSFAGDGFRVETGPYPEGPTTAAMGDNFYVIERKVSDAANVSAEFGVFGGESAFFTAGDYQEITSEFYLWLGDGFNANPDWGFTSGRSPFAPSNILTWFEIGGPEDEPRRISYYNGGWVRVPIPEGVWNGGAWNHVSVSMKAVDNQPSVTMSINQSDPIPLGPWGTLRNAITQVYARAGGGGTEFFVDEWKVTGIVLEDTMCAEDPPLAKDLSGDIIFSHNFELETDVDGAAPGAPEIGSYDGDSNGVVVSGQYDADGVVGPRVANSGNNYLALQADQSLSAVFSIDPFAAGTIRTISARFYLWLNAGEPGDVNFGLADGDDFTRSSIAGPIDGGTGNDKDLGNWNGAEWEYNDIGGSYQPGGDPDPCTGWNLVEVSYTSSSGIATAKVNGSDAIELSILGDSIEAILGKLSIAAGDDSTVYFLDDIQVAKRDPSPPPSGGVGTVIFHYTFENSAEGDLPAEEDPEIGTLENINVTIINGEYLDGVGPSGACFGGQYVAFNRNDSGSSRNLNYIWDKTQHSEEGFETLGELTEWHTRMYVWIEQGNANWGIGNGNGPWGNEVLPWWTGFFGSPDGANALAYTGGWINTNYDEDWKIGEWNEVIMDWTPAAGLTIRANGGEPAPVPAWNPEAADIPVHLIYQRAGDGTTDYFVDEVMTVVNGGLPLPGTTIFFDDFDGLPAEELPAGDALVGFYPETGISTPVAEEGYPSGPESALSGSQYLQFDRAGLGGTAGGREMAFGLAGEPFTPSSTKLIHVRFYMWIDPGFENFGTWGLANATSGFADTILFNWLGVGGRAADGVFPRDLYQYDGAESYLPTGSDWLDSAWNKLEYTYNSFQQQWTVRLNDGAPMDTLLWGNPDELMLSSGRMRAGSGTSSFFIDDFEVSVVTGGSAGPGPGAWPEGTVFGDGFENSVIEDPPIPPGRDDPDQGTYGAVGNFIAVVDGFDPFNDDSPETAQDGNNHIGIDDRDGGIGDPALTVIFDAEKSPANINSFQADFWIWLASSADNMATFAVGSSANLRPESQIMNAVIGGDDLTISYWDGVEYIPTTATVPDREWAKITLWWNIESSGMMMVSVNDGDAVELGLFGPPDIRIDRLIFGRAEGSEQTIYYLDTISAESFSLQGLYKLQWKPSLAGDSVWEDITDWIDDTSALVEITEGTSFFQVLSNAGAQILDINQQDEANVMINWGNAPPPPPPPLVLVLVDDGFENALSGEPPGDPDAGTIVATDNVVVQEGPYEVGDVVGPAEAFSGNNYLVMDRKNLGGNNLLFSSDEEVSVDELKARFYVWADPVINVSFGLGSGDVSGSSPADTLTWNNLVDGNWQVWDGNPNWANIDISADWLVGQWNEILICYDGATLIGSVNGGAPVDLVMIGTDLVVNTLRFRSGNAESAYFLDEVALAVNGEPLPSKAPRLLLDNGLEGAVSGGPPGGTVEGTDNVLAQEGPYAAGDEVGPEAANSGSNYLVMDRVNLGGNNLLFRFNKNGTTLDESNQFKVRFHVWAEPLRSVSFGLGNDVVAGSDVANTLIWNNLAGGIWQRFGGGVWNNDFDISADWLAAAWNEIVVCWDGRSLTGSVNGGPPTELILVGDTGMVVDTLRFRSGDGTSTYYLDDLSVVTNGAPFPPLPVLQNDSFENAASGEAPGESKTGTIEASESIFVQEGPYAEGDEIGPEAANTGNNYLVMDRVNFGGNNLILRLADGGASLDDSSQFKISFSIWADPVRNCSFGFGNTAVSGDPPDTVSWNNLNDGIWSRLADEGWNNDFDISADWLVGAWNDIVICWNGDTLTGAVNGGIPTELLMRAGTDLVIDALRFRSGGGTSAYYIDNVVIRGEPRE